MRSRFLERRPPELVVYDATHECPYLPGLRARLPMRLPARALQGIELDERLAEGDRRHGAFLYRPSCPSCTACEAIRIPVDDFVFTRSQRRALNKGDRLLSATTAEPIADEEHLALYEKHKRERALDTNGSALTLEGYRGFLVERCVHSVEVQYRMGETLVAVAVTDRGLAAASAVYCFWDPDYAHLGIGTYSILHHVRLCREWGVRYLYLGLYIERNPHMSYKARFLPHERLIDGRWRRFE